MKNKPWYSRWRKARGERRPRRTPLTESEWEEGSSALEAKEFEKEYPGLRVHKRTDALLPKHYVARVHSKFVRPRYKNKRRRHRNPGRGFFGMKNSTMLLIAGGLFAWWYFRTNRNRLQARNTAVVRARGAVAAPQAGMGLCCPCTPTSPGMGTMYSEDPVTGPYGEQNLFGDSGVVANRQGVWDRLDEVSAL